QVQRNAKRIRGDAPKAGHLIRRKAVATPTGIGRHGGEQLAARDAGRGAGLVYARHCRLEFLVGRTGATLQIIERFVSEDFPPSPFRQVIERPPFFPGAEIFGFVVRRYGALRPHVIRADGTAAYPDGGQQSNETGEGFHRSHGWAGAALFSSNGRSRGFDSAPAAFFRPSFINTT